MTHVNSWRGGRPRKRKPALVPQRTLTGWEKNRMRDRETVCITPGVNLDDYQIVGYLCGTRVDALKDMNWTYFDFVSFINSSTNPVNGITGYHFTGSRQRGNKPAQLMVVVAIKK